MIFPCYRQELWYSCFATCVRMILEYYGIEKSESDLRILLKTTPRFGTICGIAEKEIKRLGFELEWKRNWTLEELDDLVSQSMPAIAGFISKSEDTHAVVLTDISDMHVMMVDPEIGELIRLEKLRFLELWSRRKNVAGYLRKL